MKDQKLCQLCGECPAAPRPLVAVQTIAGDVILNPQPLRCFHCLATCHLCGAPAVTTEHNTPSDPTWRPAMCCTCADEMATQDDEAQSGSWRADERRFLELGWAEDIADALDQGLF